jgi:hypothetical protein
MDPQLPEICQELELDEPKCRKLDKIVQDLCSGKTAKPRKRSKWQECIASRRKGKPFDPKAIKELAKEYRAGKCP